MRKRSIGIASALAATIFASNIAVGTPVFAGTTSADLYNQKAAEISEQIGNNLLAEQEVSTAVMSVIATKSNKEPTDEMKEWGTSYYDVTKSNPLEVRLYFNINSAYPGRSSDQHALACGLSNYELTPSGGKTTDKSKWPYPQLADTRYERYAMEALISEVMSSADGFSYGDNAVKDRGNLSGCFTDAPYGVMKWTNAWDLLYPYRQYQQYSTDTGNGMCYQVLKFSFSGINGKPGDRIAFRTWLFNSDLGANSDYWPIPYEEYNETEGNAVSNAQQGGKDIITGYIYIPYELKYDANGGGTAPEVNEQYTCDHNIVTVPAQGDMVRGDAKLLGWSETLVSNVITDAKDIPQDMIKKEGKYTISKNTELHAVWGDKDLVINDKTVPVYKRLIQNGTDTIQDMTFDFTFEQKTEWDGVSYVSTATPIGDKSVTLTETDRYTGSDPYVGDLTGKKLYYGEYGNVLSDFEPQEAGTYLYLVKEKIPATGALPNVTYTGSEYVLKIVVDANKEIADIPTITLYKDSTGKTKSDYTNPPRIFDEKQELIFYNTYGPSGGTTPTGIMTNILPFIIIGGVGAGGLALYVMLKVWRRRKIS